MTKKKKKKKQPEKTTHLKTKMATFRVLCRIKGCLSFLLYLKPWFLLFKKQILIRHRIRQMGALASGPCAGGSTEILIMVHVWIISLTTLHFFGNKKKVAFHCHDRMTGASSGAVISVCLPSMSCFGVKLVGVPPQEPRRTCKLSSYVPGNRVC